MRSFVKQALHCFQNSFQSFKRSPNKKWYLYFDTRQQRYKEIITSQVNKTEKVQPKTTRQICDGVFFLFSAKISVCLFNEK